MNNGPIWNVMAEEYEIWLDGEFITWASNSTVANKIYNETRTTKYEHLRHTQAWELHTLTTPCGETIEALDQAYKDTEPLKPFKVENGLNVACAYCEKEAEQQSIPLAYDPGKVSHGICPKHYQEQIELVERWEAEQKNVVKVL
jgi:hypothetical protein